MFVYMYLQECPTVMHVRDSPQHQHSYTTSLSLSRIRVKNVPERKNRYTVKKKGPRGVTAQGCYSPGGVLVTHKGVLLTSMSVGKVW